MVLACSGIDDDERRAECFRAARDRFAPSTEKERLRPVKAVPESIPSELAKPRPTADHPTSQPEPIVASNESDGGVEVPSVLSGESPAPIDQPTLENSVTERSVTQSVISVPNRFSATVTAVHALVRDRQLVALDGKLVFEGGQASIARIKVGDPVEVVRASAFLGRRFRMTGPSHRTFTGSRIRCERLDLSDANRRKCNAVLGVKNQ